MRGSFRRSFRLGRPGVVLLRAALAAGGAAAILHATDGAAEDTTRACIDANEQAQRAQHSARLTEARRLLVRCANDSCPPLVRADCARLLSDLTQSLPSVIVDARDASGVDTTQVRVLLDGALIATHLNGMELDVDPGEHTLRFESSGGQTREQKLVLKEGEKRRRLSVDFADPKTPAAGPSSSAQPETAASSPSSGAILPIVLLGVGALGIAGFATLGVMGLSQENSLSSSCAPNCKDDRLSPVRTDYLLSDVSLGVGIAGLGGALLYYWLNHGKAPATTAFRVGAAPLRGGLQAGAQIGW